MHYAEIDVGQTKWNRLFGEDNGRSEYLLKLSGGCMRFDYISCFHYIPEIIKVKEDRLICWICLI